jgi:serine/threonine-protein kinase
LGLVALVGVAIGVALWSLISPSPPPQQSLNRFVITPSSTAPLAEEAGLELAISSDGKQIVYLAEPKGSRQLYVRSLDDFVATPIPGTEGASDPFFSPDGEWLAFFADQNLKKISLNGGPAITLSDLETEGRGGSWVEGTIVYGSPTGLYRVSADGGEPETLATVDHERSEIGYGQPTILPGGKAVLFNIGTEVGVPSQVAVVSLETGEKSTLLEEDTFSPRYVPTGHLIYSSDGSTLMAVPFDPERLEVMGSPVPVLQGVRSYAVLDLAFSPIRRTVIILSGWIAQEPNLW